jgi:hypothetical protein
MVAKRGSVTKSGGAKRKSLAPVLADKKPRVAQAATPLTQLTMQSFSSKKGSYIKHARFDLGAFVFGHVHLSNII